MRRTRRISRPRQTKRSIKFELICPSDPKEIGSVETFLHRVNKRMKFDDGMMYRLLVATTEAVNNAIVHGNRTDPLKLVIVTCLITRRSMKIRVRDQGAGFDPGLVPNPLDDKNLLKESGRGVFLMRSLMDDVRFKHFKYGSLVEMLIRFDRLP